MKYYIDEVADRVVGLTCDLTEEQTDRFFKWATTKKGSLHITLLGVEGRALVVLSCKSTLNAHLSPPYSKEELKKEDGYGYWDRDDAKLWDNIKLLDDFFKKYHYAISVKILPKSAMPDVDDFIEKEQIRYEDLKDKDVMVTRFIAGYLRTAMRIRDFNKDETDDTSSENSDVSKPKGKSPQSKKSKATQNNDRGETIYDEGVKEFLRGLVEGVNKGKLTSAEVEESLRNSERVAAFLVERPEFKNKKNPTTSRSIMSALDHGRCKDWANRDGIWKEIGASPKRSRDAWDNNPTNETKTGNKSPHPDCPHGFNVPETGRIECNSAVEDYFYALNVRLDSNEIDYTEYRELYYGRESLATAATWIQGNVPEFNDTNIEKIKNGVKYSDAWHNKKDFLLPNNSPPHKS